MRRLTEKKTVKPEIRKGCNDEFILGFIVGFMFILFSLFTLLCRKDRSYRKGLLSGMGIHLGIILVWIIHRVAVEIEVAKRT